jgi:ubiquinone/menaquinone biosynthesis C-methylase UbiE
MALSKLFKLINHKQIIADVGGGFGRLSPTYAPIFKLAYLFDPSLQMLKQAKNYCHRFKNILIQRGSLEKIPLPEHSLDSVLVVRTLHHCPNIEEVFSEFNRVLKPKGFLVLEFANKNHLKNILKSLLLGHSYFAQSERFDIATKNKVPFFNYNPKYIEKLLNNNHFKTVKTLSVSNLRGYFFKKYIPFNLLMKIENFLQSVFSGLYFGPSIFILAQKEG